MGTDLKTVDYGAAGLGQFFDITCVPVPEGLPARRLPNSSSVGWGCVCENLNEFPMLSDSQFSTISVLEM